MADRDNTVESMDQREKKLLEKQALLDKMELDIKKREKALKQKEKEKKQVLLRLAPSLWNEIAEWAEEDIRSINGQIEYLLADAVRKRKGR